MCIIYVIIPSHSSPTRKKSEDNADEMCMAMTCTCGRKWSDIFVKRSVKKISTLLSISETTWPFSCFLTATCSFRTNCMGHSHCHAFHLCSSLFLINLFLSYNTVQRIIFGLAERVVSNHIESGSEYSLSRRVTLVYLAVSNVITNVITVVV